MDIFLAMLEEVIQHKKHDMLVIIKLALNLVVSIDLPKIISSAIFFFIANLVVEISMSTICMKIIRTVTTGINMVTCNKISYYSNDAQFKSSRKV
jgi:hypothetical protein